MLRTRAWILLNLIAVLGFGFEVRAGEQRTGDEVIFPVVLSGSSAIDQGFGSILHLMNLSTTTSVVAVKAFSRGAPDDLIGSPSPTPDRLFHLAPNQALRVPLGAVDPGLRESWLGVAVLEGAADAGLRLIHNNFRDRFHQTSDVLVPGSPQAKVNRLFAAWESQGGCFPHIQSGYALVNPSREEDAEVELIFVGQDNLGVLKRAETRLRIPPLGRRTGLLAGLFHGLFPPPNSDIGCLTVQILGEGTVTAISNVPIASEVLEVNLNTGHFVNLPRRPMRLDDGSEDQE